MRSRTLREPPSSRFGRSDRKGKKRAPMATHVPTLLAFGLANSALIYGLAAASVPIIIHLLNRRRFREVQFAAMRFLIAAVKKNSRKIRIEQWLLLAVR